MMFSIRFFYVDISGGHFWINLIMTLQILFPTPEW